MIKEPITEIIRSGFRCDAETVTHPFLQKEIHPDQVETNRQILGIIHIFTHGLTPEQISVGLKVLSKATAAESAKN